MADTLEYHPSAVHHTEDSFDRLFGQSRTNAGYFQLIGFPGVGFSLFRHLPRAFCPCQMLDHAEFRRISWFVCHFDVVRQISFFVFLFDVCGKIWNWEDYGSSVRRSLERRKRSVVRKKGEVWTSVK